MEKKKKILVAVRSRANERLSFGLSNEFDLTFCDSLKQAKLVLFTARFDLVLCGVNFDDSRMFDLLKFIKKHPYLRQIPFMCIKVFEGVLHEESFEGARKAAALLDAESFIDLSSWTAELGEASAHEKLRMAIREVLERHEQPPPP